MATPTNLASASSSPATAGAFQTALGAAVANGTLVFELSRSASISGGGGIAPQKVNVSLDANGKVASGQSIFRNTDLSPSGTTYQMQLLDSSGNKIADFGTQTISGAAPIDLALFTPTSGGGGIISFSNAVLQSPQGDQTITGGFNLINSGPLREQDGTVSAPALSFSSETNTGLYRAAAQDVRLSVNGSDSFRVDSTAPTVPSGRPLAWGSAGVTSRDTGLSRTAAATLAIGNGTQGDITGTLKAQTISLPTSANTLPATIANDASGGTTSTTNGGKSLQWSNTGILIVNPSSLSSGAALTVGGTSSTTGGMSIFVGPNGGQTESAAIYPADGAAAPFRVASLQGRTISAGLLSGAINWQITNAGVATTFTLGGAGSTAPHTFVNRFRHNQGTALVSGDFSLSAGWGNTSSISGLSGTDSAFTLTITSGGTGQAANPTITLTFHDGTWTNTPIVCITRGDGSTPQTGFWITQAATSATQAVLQFVGTPIAASGYIIWVTVTGK
jgi:fibronectin-binding autotransporter adhesin